MAPIIVNTIYLSAAFFFIYLVLIFPKHFINNSQKQLSNARTLTLDSIFPEFSTCPNEPRPLLTFAEWLSHTTVTMLEGVLIDSCAVFLGTFNLCSVFLFSTHSYKE